ncbi:hypothetical protein, partial [Leuconostoc citreum]|uniref:hypothetical protein n=1 Tax=Leuconostoc citreum TaxID=33964 RepID=UPI0021A8FC1E
VGQVAKTLPFHGGIESSILSRAISSRNFGCGFLYSMRLSKTKTNMCLFLFHAKIKDDILI